MPPRDQARQKSRGGQALAGRHMTSRRKSADWIARTTGAHLSAPDSSMVGDS